MEVQEHWHCIYCGRLLEREGEGCCGENDSELLADDPDFEVWLDDMDSRGDEPGIEEGT